MNDANQIVCFLGTPGCGKSHLTEHLKKIDHITFDYFSIDELRAQVMKQKGMEINQENFKKLNTPEFKDKSDQYLIRKLKKFLETKEKNQKKVFLIDRCFIP